MSCWKSRCFLTMYVIAIHVVGDYNCLSPLSPLFLCLPARPSLHIMFPYISLPLSLSISSLFFHPFHVHHPLCQYFPFFSISSSPSISSPIFLHFLLSPITTQFPFHLRLSLPSLSRDFFNLYYYRRAVFELSGISSRAVAIRQRSWRRFFCAYMLPIRAKKRGHFK